MKNLKNEKGAIAIIVLASVLLFTTVLLSTYMVISNKIKAQKEIIKETKTMYETDTENAYNSFFANNQNFIPLYTNDQYLNIATEKLININGKYYNFTKDDYYVLMNDLEIQEDELPENWLEPEKLFYNEENIGNIDYNGHVVNVKYNDGEEIVYNGEKLPYGYYALEYIESTGTQYIDTGVKASIEDSTFDIDIMFLQSTSLNQCIIGAWDSSNNVRRYRPIWRQDKTGCVIQPDYFGNKTSEWETAFTIEDYKKYNIVTHVGINETCTFAIDGIIKSSYYNSLNEQDSERTLYLFAQNDINEVDLYSYVRIYKVKITKNNESIREFIPCLRKSDNVIGMYDLVNNEFYTNQGTGTFIAGPEVK